jgi:hypothetical protein
MCGFCCMMYLQVQSNKESTCRLGFPCVQKPHIERMVFSRCSFRSLPGLSIASTPRLPSRARPTPISATAQKMVQEDKQTRMEEAALRVKQLEAAAEDAHRQAQELNKQGRSVGFASTNRKAAAQVMHMHTQLDRGLGSIATKHTDDERSVAPGVLLHLLFPTGTRRARLPMHACMPLRMRPVRWHVR